MGLTLLDGWAGGGLLGGGGLVVYLLRSDSCQIWGLGSSRRTGGRWQGWVGGWMAGWTDSWRPGSMRMWWMFPGGARTPVL